MNRWSGRRLSLLSSCIFYFVVIATHGLRAQCVPKPQGLVSWWRAEGDAIDSADSNNGSISGGLLFSTGKVSTAFLLDGSTAGVSLSNPTNLAGLINFTLETWLQRRSATIASFDGPDGHGHIWGFGRYGYSIFLDAEGYIGLSQTGYEYVANTNRIADTNWHHVAVTKNGSNVFIYVDGLGYQTPAFDPSFDNSGPAMIGAIPFDSGYHFYGLLDEMSIYNRALSSNEVASIYLAGNAGKCPPTACVPAPATMVGWWRAEENANDSAGTNHGVLNDGVTFQDGEIGRAFQFSGTNQFVVVSNSPALNPTNSISIEAWVYPTQLPTLEEITMDIATKDGETSSRQYVLTLDGHQVFSGHIGVPAGLQQIYGATPVHSNQWYHVVETYNGTNLVLYVNGTLDGSMPVSGPIITTTQPFRIGGGSPPGTPPYYFKGKIDEVSLYNRALSMSEVASLYSAGSAGKCTNSTPPPPPPAVCVNAPSNIVSWWRAEGNAVDSIDSNNGSISGALGFATGAVNTAFLLDGSTAAVTLSNPTNLVALTNFTIETWVQRRSATIASFDGPDGHGHIWGFGQYGYSVFLDANGYVGLSKTGYEYVANTNRISDTNWHHVAITKAGSDVFIYVDGAGYKTPPYDPGFINSGQAMIGAIPFPGGYHFYGLIDELTIYSRALNSNEIAGVYLAGSAGKCPPPTCVLVSTNVIGWWRAEGNANDSAGTNNGGLNGEVTFTDGEVGRAFQFSGTNQNVVVSNAPGLNPTNGITLEAWVYPTHVPALDEIAMDIASKDGETSNRQYLLTLDGHQVFSAHIGVPSGLRQIYGTTPVQANHWYHVVETYNGSNFILYVNGAVDASMPVTGSIITTTQPLRIGGGSPPNTPPYFFKGKIDEVTLYNRALSPAEVAGIYQADGLGKCPFNRRPLASSFGAATVQNRSMTIATDKVLAFCSDPDGDSLNVSSVSGTSTNGGTVDLSAGSVVYTPRANYVGADRFTFTVSDGLETANAFVFVLVRSATAPSGNMFSPNPIAGGYQVGFAGVPGRSYTLQRASNVNGPWQTIATVVCGANGRASYTDTNAPPVSAFYRTIYP